VRQSPIHLSVIALVLVILLAIVMKAVLHRGTPFQGGMPSGHSAVAFAGWAAVTYISAGVEYGMLISFLSLLMAALVAQSRVESGIHSVWEVIIGAALGVLVTTFIFQLWG
ncbi:MAG: phosphatase PAP2 family protein, partial [Thermoleophilia bacterium]